MKRKTALKLIRVITAVFIFSIVIINCGATENQKIRQPAVAGTFYPADPAILTQMVDVFLAKAPSRKSDASLIALISPHAGYVYSGHVASYAYKQLEGKSINRVVVISPSHIEAFQGVSVYPGDAYATPLGNVEIDKPFVKKLADDCSVCRVDDIGHKPNINGRGEHALEVQLPFLQRVLGKFKLVALVMGEQSYQTCRSLGNALAELITDDHTIIVASSDLSHFHPYDEAVALDSKVINAIQEWDYFNLSRNFASRQWEACGGGPIIATMIAAEKLGAKRAELLKYANSGDVPQGSRSQVVGYSAFAFFRDEKSKSNQETEFRLNINDQRELMLIAQNAVREIVEKNSVSALPKLKSPELLADRGAFVTLNKEGRLRGCIGYTSPTRPLYETVHDAAIQAAVRDPRFSAVRQNELEDLSFEISVLSPFRKVNDVREIEVGRHGLLIKKGGQSGLLLPQVAAEYRWDRITFLQQTCRKAGLPLDAWREDDTDIFMFTAFVFGEGE